jgi:hypothetical protein
MEIEREIEIYTYRYRERKNKREREREREKERERERKREREGGREREREGGRERERETAVVYNCSISWFPGKRNDISAKIKESLSNVHFLLCYSEVHAMPEELSRDARPGWRTIELVGKRMKQNQIL